MNRRRLGDRIIAVGGVLLVVGALWLLDVRSALAFAIPSGDSSTLTNTTGSNYCPPWLNDQTGSFNANPLSANLGAPSKTYLSDQETLQGLTDVQQSVAATCQALFALLGSTSGAVPSQEHSDEAQLHVDLGTLSANLGTVHTDSVARGTQLTTLHNDLVTLDSDVKASAYSGGGSVAVSNFPTDQTVAIDTTSSAQMSGIGQALHEDLWWILGAIVGCWLFGIVIRKVWP